MMKRSCWLMFWLVEQHFSTAMDLPDSPPQEVGTVHVAIVSILQCVALDEPA